MCVEYYVFKAAIFSALCCVAFISLCLAVFVSSLFFSSCKTLNDFSMTL